MDSLVKEVEGNMKPIRAERLEDDSVSVYQEPPQPKPGFYQAPMRMPDPPPVYRESAPYPAYQEVTGMPMNREVPRMPVNQEAYVYPHYREVPPQPVYPEPRMAVQTPEPRAAVQTPDPRTAVQTPEPAPKESAPAPAETTKENSNDEEKDLFLHVHRENVKCYRNTQATIIENSNGIKQGLDEKHANIHSWLLGLLILSIINFGATALLILHMIFGFV